MHPEGMTNTEMRALHHWRQALAEAQEAQEAAINGALLGLGALDGMFTDRGELRDAVNRARDLLQVEAENLRLAASRARES